jgi:hypothetical protein
MSADSNDIVRELEEIEDERDALALTLARIATGEDEPGFYTMAQIARAPHRYGDALAGTPEGRVPQ